MRAKLKLAAYALLICALGVAIGFTLYLISFPESMGNAMRPPQIYTQP